MDGSVVRAKRELGWPNSRARVAHDLQDSDQFGIRVSADLSYRFNAPSKVATQNLPAIQSSLRRL